MNLQRISALRSVNQFITDTRFITAKEVAGWMGALQAQDYPMSKWAFGVRLKNSTEFDVNNEIDSGDIIRTHLLRPTWHFTSSDDVYWILKLSASHIKASLKFRDKQLGLTETIFRKCHSVFETVLRDKNHLTREELFAELVKARLRVKNDQASHIFVRAEVEGIICSGRQKAGKPTYALLGERVPEDKRKFIKEEALRELGLKYFRSRGPATIQDFIWWSGLTAGEAKIALENNRPNLVSEVFENQTYWYSETTIGPGTGMNDGFLLPAYDEFLISYRDRSASLPDIDQKVTISRNGIFYPLIVINGNVIGTWKRTSKKDSIIITATLFKKNAGIRGKSFEKALLRFSNFINKNVELIII
jgi:hypothetical protein